MHIENKPLETFSKKLNWEILPRYDCAWLMLRPNNPSKIARLLPEDSNAASIIGMSEAASVRTLEYLIGR